MFDNVTLLSLMNLREKDNNTSKNPKQFKVICPILVLKLFIS